MSWLPNGPRFVFAPRDANFHRLSRRNENGQQGLVARIAVDPTDQSVVYTVLRPTSGGTGLLRGTGAGTATESWSSIVDGLQQANPSIDPSCVAVDPVTPSRIFMGSWNDGSVYVSTTSGDTWAPGVAIGARVRKLVIDPRTATDPSNTVLYAATDNGLYRSANSGATWTNVLAGDVWSFSASMPAGGPDAYYAGVLRSGLQTTADPTGTWTNLNNAAIGLPAYDPGGSGGENFSVVYADLCANAPTRVYVVLLDKDGNFGSLYTSGSPTTAWSQVTITGTPPGTAYGFYNFFGVYDFAFAVAPNSPGDGANDVMFFGGVGFVRSTDGGQTWQSPPDVLHADHHEFAFFPAMPAAGVIPTLYIGCDGGLATSDRYCDPAVDITSAPPDFDELDAYADTGVVQNYDHGAASVATYAYASHASFTALQYTAAQDTGIAGGVKTGVWRGLGDADATQIAVAPGSDGVKVWIDLGQYNSWPEYRVLFGTDQGNYGLPTSFVTSPSGALIAATSQFVVSPGEQCLLGMQSLDANAAPGSGNPIRNTVGVIDQTGSAQRISQDFTPSGVSALAVSSSGTDAGYCAAGNRVYTTASVAAATSATVWNEIATGRPIGIAVASLAVDPGGIPYALASYPVVSGATTTPLFSLSGGTWTAQPCSGVPAGLSLGKLLADPVNPAVLYVAAGARVYRLTSSGGTWTWTDVSDNLPGQPVYDMWIANAGTPASPRVLLRVAIPTRSVWELDVTSAPSAPPITLYLRDNFLDQGLFAQSPDGVPSPYAPSDPSKNAVHWICADIKVDAQQAPGGGATPFFQTDPEAGTIPISPIAFDCLTDASQSLPSTDAARVHVQVHNASNVPAQNVVVWAIYANASGHVPSLAASASMGNAFPFWSQFGVSGGAGTITPNLPADSPWQAIGPPRTLSGIDAAHPKVASWNWTVPVLATGDPGHYCIVAFVQSAANPITETAFDVDTIVPRNRTIGQKNLHIGPALMGGPGPHHGPGPHGAPSMSGLIEFNNPQPFTTEYDFLFDFRALPKELEARVQFGPMKTVMPHDRSIFGIAGEHRGTLVETTDLKHRERKSGKRRVIAIPKMVDRVYVAEPSSRLLVHGVEIPAFGAAHAFFTIVNRGTLPEGAEYRFTVKQSGQRAPAGGSVYVVRIAGNRPQPHRLVAPSHDYRLYLKHRTTLEEADPTSLPSWIRYEVNAQRLNTVKDAIEP